MACAAGQLTEADLAALRAGRPVPRIPPGDQRVAVASAREARTLAEFRADLVGRSGVPMLRTVLHQRVFARADLLRCQRALRGLSAMAHRLRPDRRAPTAQLRGGAPRRGTPRARRVGAARRAAVRRRAAEGIGPVRRVAAARRGGHVGDRPARPARGRRPPGCGVRGPRGARPVAADRREPHRSRARHRAASVLIRTCEEILAHPVIGATARYAGSSR